MPYETTGTTTGDDVFKIAITLMDELNDAGKYNYDDTKEYRNRTVSILNVLQLELYRYSDTYRKNRDWEKGRRAIPDAIEDIDDVIDLDDYICKAVMPYGLAAHLLLDENPTTASFFQQRYDELKLSLLSGIPAESEDIEDVYGPVGGLHPYNEFSRWM